MRIPDAGSVAWCERQGAGEGEVVLVGLGEDRLEVVGPVVGALGEDLDPVRRGLDLRQDLVQEGAGPSGRGDGEVTPGFSGRQRPHLQAAVAGALEGDRVVVGGHRAQVVEGQGRGRADRAADLQGAVVLGHGEVAAHVVELGGSDLADEGGRRCLGVVRRGVDHHQRGACRLEIISNGHVFSLLGQGDGAWSLRSRSRRRWARGRR